MFRPSLKLFGEKKQLTIHIEGKIYNVIIQLCNYKKVGVDSRLAIISFDLVDRLNWSTSLVTVVFKTNTFDVKVDPKRFSPGIAQDVKRYKQLCIEIIGILYENAIDNELCDKTDYSKETELILKTTNIFVSSKIAHAITKGCIRLIHFAEQ